MPCLPARFIAVVVCAPACFLALSATSALAQSTLAIRNVTVVDVTDGSLQPGRTVLVDGDRIASIGPAGAVEVPAEAEVVDGAGRYLVPGLWDMHAHATFEGRPETFFPLLLANGITGIRDPWGSLEVAARARAAVEEGALAGPPRVVAAGNLVDGPPGMWPGSQIAGSPAEGRRIVDSLHAAGAPFIKVYHSLAPPTYFAIAERSRELGLPFAGHVPFGIRAARASDAGQRAIEHLFGVFLGCSTEQEAIMADAGGAAEALAAGDMAAATDHFAGQSRRTLETQDDDACRRLAERFVENETWQVPTLVSLEGKAYSREHAAADDPRTAYFDPPRRWLAEGPWPGVSLSDEQWNDFQARFEREKEIVGLLAEAGVPILAGSDTAVPWAFPGFGLHDELELLVEAGMTPLQALRAATLEPARFLGRTDELGTVAEGNLADLVLLDADPLRDITNTQRIRPVIADGRLYRRADLDRILGQVAASVRERRTPD